MAAGSPTSALLTESSRDEGQDAVGAAIRGVAMAVPARLVSNQEIATRLGVEEQWITKRTGTDERPWAAPGERLSDFAAAAGRAGSPPSRWRAVRSNPGAPPGRS